MACAEAAIRRSTAGAGSDAKILSTLNNWLRPDCAFRLEEEYPTVFGPQNHAELFLLEQDGELLAHAAVVENELTLQNECIKTLLVGSVVVNPRLRGQGLGRAIMSEVVQAFRESAAELCMLWSTKETFYARLGFAKTGLEYICLLHSAERAASGLRKYRTEDVPVILALHEAKSVHSKRDELLFAQLLRVPRCDCFVLEAANRVVAYACIGKGLDFENVIHECGGSPEDLARLLPSICRVQQKELYVMIPPSRPELLQALAPWSSGASFGHLGLAISKRQLPPEFYLEGLDSV